jgi:hypothetical protein
MRQQPLPGMRATARLVAMTLLATVVLIMTLLLGQLVARPDPPAPPAPQGPVTPPLRLGPSAGEARETGVSGGRAACRTHPGPATTRRPATR